MFTKILKEDQKETDIPEDMKKAIWNKIKEWISEKKNDKIRNKGLVGGADDDSRH